MYLFSWSYVFGSKHSALDSFPIFILTLVLLLLSLSGRSAAQQAPQHLSLGVIAGGGSYTDSGGNRWNADQPYSQGSWGYVGGKIYKTSNSIANTNNEPLYQSERYGNFSYKFDVPNGLYDVALHFAEIYWKSPDERIFDVFIEGSRVLDRYDICAAVGCNRALALAFPGVRVQDGQLNIDFVTIKDNAKISAISITSSDITSPAVSLTSPTAGTSFSPGQIVTATGSGQNLRWDIDRINDGLGSFATGQGNSITFTVPANSNASQFIRITLTGDGGTAIRDYTIVPAPFPPAVSLTSPAAGTAFSPGQVVTATGSGQNLRWDIDRINDGLGSFATGQGNSITFTVPANSNASQFIRITLTGDGGTATRDYKIVASPPLPPVVSVISPTVGTTFSPGQAVIATGSGQNLRWDIDRINDGLPSFVTGQGNSITFTVPANSNASQFIRISLTGNGGTAMRDYNIVVPPPPPPIASVRKYDIFERSVTNANSYTNKFDFNVIELRTSFTSPSGKTYSFFGFHDGDGQGGQNGNVWKFRFMPDETGTWRYSWSWTDGTTGGSDNFEVVASSNKGVLKIDPAHPHSIIYANGEHFFWNGDTEWFFLSDSFSQTARFAAIDFLAAKKVNNLLMVMLNDDASPVFPWISRADRSRFDVARLSRWEAIVDYLKSKDMIADLWFFSDDSQSLYPHAFSREEDLYFRNMIARFAAFSNVTWNLALEYDEYRDDGWVISRAQFVKENDPFDHLIGVHRTDEQFRFAGNPNLDHTSLQSLGADHAHLNRVVVDLRAATEQAGRPIPIIHEEFFIEGSFGNLEQFRKAIWAITTGGGFYKAASLGWWWGTPYQSGQHFDIARNLYEFITTIPYWQMSPNNSLVSTGYALVNPGREYLIYLPSGGSVTVNLAAASGTLPLEWYNTRTGTYTQQTTTSGGGSRTFQAPDNNDWVLHIGGQDALLFVDPL